MGIVSLLRWPWGPSEERYSVIGSNSLSSFERAKQVFVDGTTRVTVERDPTPRYVSKGEGAYVHDVDGRAFLDLNGNYTTLIHGHGFQPVVEAVVRQMQSGTCFANPTLAEIELAELLCERVPRMDSIRFVNTGSEAVMFAVKAARAFTGRPCIAKIEGAYHGAYDWVEVSQASTPANWGSAERPNAVPFYKGQPESVLAEVVTIRLNDAEGARRLIAENADRLAAVLLDPMPSRAGLISPSPEFLEAVQSTAAKHGVLIISDEVLNFRQGYQGIAARFGVKPDLYALGKIIGGGLPIGAIGGRREVMSVFDAAGKRPALPQGGTFSANPLSMVAGEAAMRALTPAVFERLEALGDRLRDGIRTHISTSDAPFVVTGAASLFRIHPKKVAPRDFRDVTSTPAENDVMREMTRYFAENGILLPFGAAACLSTPMTQADIDHVAGVFGAFIKDRSALIGKISV
ncbi:glutamate-1-semialdehyde 2,1-aminomutase [Pandoraea pulmonicola]|uniref:Glutamate-1-semialdehyde 2,1-aminomutase n=2 Tax=Pandoraea pulmonicola TaxID=93221 RepID=A0ABM5S1E9_PANPU|nr:glutamate-1-semialdehyde 2,1-aminomutase [Pandoraea pulmonicola]